MRVLCSLADATIAASGTADSAKLIAGSNEITLSVGLSGGNAAFDFEN